MWFGVSSVLAVADSFGLRIVNTRKFKSPGNNPFPELFFREIGVLSAHAFRPIDHSTPEALLDEPPTVATSISGNGNSLIAYLDACEKHYIEEVLAAQTWRVGIAADALGISRKTLWEKMRKHSIADRAKGTPST